MSSYFTSDLHFQHDNIIKYCNRPFATVDEMNEVLIKNWNDVVSKDDTVYLIGDFAFGNKNNIPKIRSALNGSIHIILGNHDVKNGQPMKQISGAGFASIQNGLTMAVDGIKVMMRHKPDMSFKPSTDATYHLCGHVHGSWNRKGPIINVGVDVCGFKPVTLNWLISQVEVMGTSHRGY